MFELRGYQKETQAGLWKYWREGIGTSPLVVIPTGGGKSVSIASMISKIRQVNQNVRILMVSHVKELVVQNSKRLQEHAPELTMDIGMMSGKIGSNPEAPILCGTIQTLARRFDVLSVYEPFDLLIVDEAHLIPTKTTSQYRKLIAYLRERNPKLRLVGFTATPYRLDSGYLHKGDDAMFDGIAYDVSVKTLIDEGCLVTPRTSWNAESMDVTKLKTKMGEYTAESQDDALKPVIQKMIINALNQGSLTDRDRWLWFFPSVESAEQGQKLLEEYKQEAVCIHGGLNDKIRDELMREFRLGQVMHCTNVNIMTTGIDIPEINHVVLARSTQSTVLYVQMCGRGLRPAEGKEQCVILDYGANAARHGVLDRPKLNYHKKKRGKKNASEARNCPKCGTYMDIEFTVCPNCFYSMPNRRQEVKLSTPFRGEMVSWLEKPTTKTIKKTYYDPWEGKSGFTTVRVKYMDEDGVGYSEWLCPEHPEQHKATSMFRSRWRRTYGDKSIPPIGVDECIEMMRSHRLQPEQITVGTPEGKEWPTIMKIKYEEKLAVR